MQVQPFLPWRRTLVAPLASIVAIDASWAIAAGAADSALAIGSPDVFDALAVEAVAVLVLEVVVAGLLQPASASAAAPAAKATCVFDRFMSPSVSFRKDEPPNTNRGQPHVNFAAA